MELPTTYGTAVGDYVFEIGFSGRLRNTLFEKILWTNGTHANNSSNNSFYFGTITDYFTLEVIIPKLRIEVLMQIMDTLVKLSGEVYIRVERQPNMVVDCIYDVATESRPLPSNTTSTTATGNCGKLQFFMRNSSGIGWNEWE